MDSPNAAFGIGSHCRYPALIHKHPVSPVPLFSLLLALQLESLQPFV
jgi:hypothetical protein